MAVLGTGTANGGCSLLHAAGLGYGASLALDLPVKVRILDKKSRRDVEDPDGLLEQIVIAWKNAGLKLPTDEIFWSIKSEIPPRQGLKSSSAISVAAIRALCDATDSTLDNADIVDIAAAAQLAAGVSITGSFDDSWAAIEGGWKLVDTNAESARQGLLLESEGPKSEDWKVLILLRGDRDKRPALEDITFQHPSFYRELSAKQAGND